MIDLLRLYENCVYSSIAHAILVLKEPIFAAEQSWDGMNYCFNNFEGTRGTISFDLIAGIMAGAARDDTSARCGRYPEFKAIELFKNAPDNIKRFAKKEALEYLYDEVNGSTQPTATIAFWSTGGEIIVDEDTEEFRNNGGEYLLTISVTHDKLREHWREQYELSEEELSAVDMIFERFTAHRNITLDDVPIIKQGRDLSEEGYEECLTSLEEIGIIIE